MKNTENKIIEWAKAKGISAPTNILKQSDKLLEECNEVIDAIKNGTISDINNEIGDVLVVCSILASQNGSDLDTCIKLAYEKIKNRKGRTINGTFIKE